MEMKWKSAGVYEAQIGEHDEMKKNSLKLFCLLKICSTSWNTNIIPMHASFLFDFFFYRKGEISTQEENISDVELIQVILPNTSVFTRLH